jgi:hypothetical protein
MEMDIDELTECFSNSASITLYNPSAYHLYVNNGALYTHDPIKANIIIGELKGIPSYIWDVNHNHYIIIEEELVLDIQQYKKNMLNWIREENCSTNLSNCFIHMVVKNNEEKYFYLVAKQDIESGQELVYNAFDFVVEHENQ